MADYKEFLDGIDRAATTRLVAVAGGRFTVTRTYHYSPPGCHDSCGVLLYTKDASWHMSRRPLAPYSVASCASAASTCSNRSTTSSASSTRCAARARRCNDWERISWDEAFDIIEEKCERSGKRTAATPSTSSTAPGETSTGRYRGSPRPSCTPPTSAPSASPALVLPATRLRLDGTSR